MATEALFIRSDSRRLPLADRSVDLVFGSPPYEAQREYAELQFSLRGDEWVRWAADVFMDCLRVCRGMVAWVIEGFTESYSYSATPFLLMAELRHRGATLRKPAVYKRQGIPGTGGPDYLRNDWEPIIVATNGGRLPWSDNTALGAPPVVRGKRYATNRNKNGERKNGDKIHFYTDPDLVNPGNVIDCGNAAALGWEDAHQNEAPFPKSLAEFFVKSFCCPGGIVLDPFSGSGTTVNAAVACGRRGIGVDIRASQCWLGQTRFMGLTVNQRRSGQMMLV